MRRVFGVSFLDKKMAETLRLVIRLPIFAPPDDPNSTRHSSTELRFSRWNNANAEKFNQRRRSIQEIEDEIRRTRRFDTAENIANIAVAELTSSSSAGAAETFKSFGTPSAPSRPSIPGKKSKYSKPPPKPSAIRSSNVSESRTAVVNRFQPGPADVKIGNDGVSYVVDGAPFEFKYSYTETPAEKPVKLREPPFAPFGPATMRRPWTGRPPLPPCKMKLKEFNSIILPPPQKKGVQPVQSPGSFSEGSGPMHVQSREEILGEPLTKDEITELVGSTMKTTSQLNIGRDGLTHNMLETIHTHWMRRRVCKIKCRGVCTVDMDNVCKQLEERTWGKIIYRKGGVVYLFRGRNYNYKTRPHFPLMLWKPVRPVYPRLIKQVPEGLTLVKATEMRQKGKNLMPICKLAKNGVYCDLVTNVREAFEECELVRINCQGLNASDYRRIGAKLKDLVPCILLSFEDDHILMWRGQNWTSSLPSLEDEADEANKMNVNSEISNTLPLDAQELSARCLQKNSVEHLSNGSHEISISSNSDGVSLHKAEVPCPTENINLPASVESDASSLSVKTHEVETVEHVAAYGNTSPIGPETSGNSINGMVDPHTDNLQDGFGAANAGRPSRSVEPCTKGVLLLLQRAVENGSALVLDDKSLDDDHIYRTAVDFVKSAPPDPVFKLPRKTIFRRSDKQEDLTLVTKDTNPVGMKGEKMEEK